MGSGGAMLKPVGGGAVGAGFGGGPSEPFTIPRKATASLQSNQYSPPPPPPPSSSSSSHLNLPVSANSTAPFRQNCTNSSHLGEKSCTRIESTMDGREGKRATGSYYDSVFGPVPSRTEVETAISDLQSFMLGFRRPELEWLQRMMCLYGPRMLQSLGYGNRVDDAFRLLQTAPSVQRMVVSISSDKAVWDAILNNQAVQNLRQSLSTAKEERPESSSEEPDLATLIVKWILDIAKAMVLELIDKFSSLVNKIFQPPEKKKPTAAAAAAAEISDRQLAAELRSSLLLSIVILLIVVVTRAREA